MMTSDAGDAGDVALTDELIAGLTEGSLSAMVRAEEAVCSPSDTRCYGFPHGVREALASRTPSGWCTIGWVAVESGRKGWDAWYNVTTGEGRLLTQADTQ